MTEEKFIEAEGVDFGKAINSLNQIHSFIADMSFRVKDNHIYLIVVDPAKVVLSYIKAPVKTNITDGDFTAPWKPFYDAFKKIGRDDKMKMTVTDSEFILVVESLKNNFKAKINIGQVDKEHSKINEKDPVDALDDWKYDEQILVSMEHFKKALGFFGKSKDEKISIRSENKKLYIYTAGTEITIDRSCGLLVEPTADFKESSFSYDYFSKFQYMLGEAILFGISKDGNYPVYVQTDLNKEVIYKHILAPRIGD